MAWIWICLYADVAVSPAFFHYFQSENAKIQDGSSPGTPLVMNSLGIGNGIINERIQAPHYPEFAVNNTYGIKAYNDTVYNYARFAHNMMNGCRDQIDLCGNADQDTASGKAICTEAADMCRDNVESPYYFYSGRGVYDIRQPYSEILILLLKAKRTYLPLRQMTQRHCHTSKTTSTKLMFSRRLGCKYPSQTVPKPKASR